MLTSMTSPGVTIGRTLGRNLLEQLYVLVKVSGQSVALLASRGALWGPGEDGAGSATGIRVGLQEAAAGGRSSGKGRTQRTPRQGSWDTGPT